MPVPVNTKLFASYIFIHCLFIDMDVTKTLIVLQIGRYCHKGAL